MRRGNLSRNRFSRRLAVVAAVCVLAASSVCVRSYYLSIVVGAEKALAVSYQTCATTVKMSYRGQIRDRYGSTLATSVRASQVAVVRVRYTFDPAHVEILSPLLGVEPVVLSKRLQNPGSNYLWLSRRVDFDEANEVKRLRIPGIDVLPRQARRYPSGPLAAHVLGFSGIDANGLEGLEKSLDEKIRGKEVEVRVCSNGRGNSYLNDADLRGANRGASLKLTLDATIQGLAASELAAQVRATGAIAGSVVVMDPRSGEILALANVPDFDPNQYGRYAVGARRNRAVTDRFEPGSTLKPFILAAALQSGAVSGRDRFFCENGNMDIGKWTIHDHHEYGELPVPEIIKVSSNICMAKIGAEAGADAVYSVLRGFGFGSTTSSGLLGEVGGLLHPASKWGDIHLANISFGQGMSTTVLQLASAYDTLANGGVRMRPYVVSEIRSDDQGLLEVTGPERVGRAVSPQVAALVSRMLEDVVSASGTAPQAQVAGVRVAGKTGTAQKHERGGYSKDRWVASFVGFLPADDPRLVIAVVIDEPQGSHYGGVVAGPVFRRIADMAVGYLQIPRRPDGLPEPLAAPPLKVVVPQPRPPTDRVATSLGHMPDLDGLALRSAMRAMDGCNCNIEVQGQGYVVGQVPAPGVKLDDDQAVSLELAAVGGLP